MCRSECPNSVLAWPVGHLNRSSLSVHAISTLNQFLVFHLVLLKKLIMGEWWSRSSVGRTVAFNAGGTQFKSWLCQCYEFWYSAHSKQPCSGMERNLLYQVTQPCRRINPTAPSGDITQQWDTKMRSGSWWTLVLTISTATDDNPGRKRIEREDPQATYDEAAARWSIKIRRIEVSLDWQHHPAPSDEQLAKQKPLPQRSSHSRKAGRVKCSAEDTRRGGPKK